MEQSPPLRLAEWTRAYGPQFAEGETEPQIERTTHLPKVLPQEGSSANPPTSPLLVLFSLTSRYSAAGHCGVGLTTVDRANTGEPGFSPRTGPVGASALAAS
jgi:hypothetical protein